MTVNVAYYDGKNGYIGADRCCVTGNTKSEILKIWNKHDMIFTLCGDSLLQSLFNSFDFEKPPKDEKDLSSWLFKNIVKQIFEEYNMLNLLEHENNKSYLGGSIICVHKSGMYTIMGDGEVCKSLDNIKCGGSGGEVALGALDNMDMKDPVKCIFKAMRSAAKYCIGVEGPFDIHCTNGKKWRAK
jgi:ATP-dependent protease HslVU (ClpYQ) peptidase subunit